ncbi:hypothetical protein AK812_SmicGene19953 [Symbiodinium microadriaticum]|uniref:Uncharacterized protein n=1 Tax=Symbiodinium microadriaticum TaxID=2951 RepID=A0A1Q9DR74_SYMMI|nr:hypothetical protein AK812_SmicGene19953 [Symbiodinium microadriaticum]CAE7225490.1 unnamed protein product [Symbiodinium sp. KB8]CAE7234022.1 unnamed protein product [Symbiodinium microadriaticum]
MGGVPPGAETECFMGRGVGVHGWASTWRTRILAEQARRQIIKDSKALLLGFFRRALIMMLWLCGLLVAPFFRFGKLGSDEVDGECEYRPGGVGYKFKWNRKRKREWKRRKIAGRSRVDKAGIGTFELEQGIWEGGDELGAEADCAVTNSFERSPGAGEENGDKRGGRRYGRRRWGLFFYTAAQAWKLGSTRLWSELALALSGKGAVFLFRLGKDGKRTRKGLGSFGLPTWGGAFWLRLMLL